MDKYDLFLFPATTTLNTTKRLVNPHPLLPSIRTNKSLILTLVCPCPQLRLSLFCCDGLLTDVLRMWPCGPPPPTTIKDRRACDKPDSLAALSAAPVLLTQLFSAVWSVALLGFSANGPGLSRKPRNAVEPRENQNCASPPVCWQKLKTKTVGLCSGGQIINSAEETNRQHRSNIWVGDLSPKTPLIVKHRGICYDFTCLLLDSFLF